ncbi:hypothetical protein B0H14DRAFT_248286 [Mycena olivaceomarginata]|nr:hypothetical protein B0H14DRAFT_248286 [Mycena olivaceomarginata]
MRRPDFSISRLICTLAPPPITRQFSAPPVLVARERTKIKGSYLLLSSSSPDNGPRKAWLGPAHQLARYALAESPATKTKVSLDTGHAMRRFARPTRFTNVTELGTRGKPYFSLKPHLSDTLKACLLSPKGVRGLFEADVVADREVITKLMFPHEASFNASFAHGVLFLEDARSKPRLDRSAVHKKIGFLRACTEMYTNRRPKLKGRVRHTFHAVVARPLGGLNLLLSGSIDCIRYKYTGHPGCYMNFVTRPLRDGKHLIRPTLWKEWYFRAHLMGVRSLFLGLIDEAGVLRRTRRLATRKLPRAARAGDGEAQWDPEVDMRWAARVLGALRDFFQSRRTSRRRRAEGGRCRRRCGAWRSARWAGRCACLCAR